MGSHKNDREGPMTTPKANMALNSTTGSYKLSRFEPPASTVTLCKVTKWLIIYHGLDFPKGNFHTMFGRKRRGSTEYGSVQFGNAPIAGKISQHKKKGSRRALLKL